MVRPGCTIGSRYRLDALLATGAWGQVWRARDVVLGRRVAVKVLRREHTGDSAALTRFRAEARLTAGLAHPNIAALHDYGEVLPAAGDRGARLAYLVMELVDGEALSAVLQRERRLTSGRTLEIVRQTAAGLAAAHAAGVVHRDVKPGNLLIGPHDSVTLTDFGIAWSESSDPLTGTGQVMGTAQYLSPEQARGAKAGPASDVYALGIVAYECLAGRRAFEGEGPVQIALKHINETPERLPADVPDAVRQLVERTLAKDPDERFPDGAALLSAVEDVLAGRAPSPPPDRHATTVLPVAFELTRDPSHPRPGGDPSRGARHAAADRRPSRRTLVGLVVLMVLAAVAAGLFIWSRGPSPAPRSGATPTPAQITTGPLAAAAYVGQPVGEAEAELTGLGLSVQLRPIQTADVPDGQVLAVDAPGGIAPGQSVTLTYAVATAPAPTPGTPGAGTVDTGSPDPGLSSAPAATVSSPAVETSTVTGHGGNGNGNGNGRGNGRGNG